MAVPVGVAIRIGWNVGRGIAEGDVFALIDGVRWLRLLRKRRVRAWERQRSRDPDTPEYSDLEWLDALERLNWEHEFRRGLDTYYRLYVLEPMKARVPQLTGTLASSLDASVSAGNNLNVTLRYVYYAPYVRFRSPVSGETTVFGLHASLLRQQQENIITQATNDANSFLDI